MAITLENLEDLKKRVIRIERELAEVRHDLEQLTTALNRGTETCWRVNVQWVDRKGWNEWFDSWFQQIGINVHPVGAEKLQAMTLQEGIRPEDNLLSSGIINMREE